MGLKMTAPFFGLKIMNLLVFLYFEPKKCFWVSTPWGLYGAEWDERWCSLCTFQPFLLCWWFWRPRSPRGTHSNGCEWGCCDSICLLGYKRTFFLQSVALPRADQCQRRGMTVSTNNGLHE